MPTTNVCPPCPIRYWVLIAVTMAVLCPTLPNACGQIRQEEIRRQDERGLKERRQPDEMAEQALQEEPVSAIPASVATAGEQVDGKKVSVDLLQLIWMARWLMLPIILMSVLVVAVGIERALSLRRRRVIPRRLVEQILDATTTRSSFHPRHLSEAASNLRSPTSTVVLAFLRKLGRPHAEVERAVDDAMQHESEKLYRNVRILNLAAAITPLMGLLGTVWGMIEAFFATANLPVGANKAESLAEGIYTALVTTAGGLVVAIPAAILAHLFEGQIQRLFHEIHDLMYTYLMPQAERLENRRTAGPPPATAPVPPPVATSVSPKLASK